MRNEIKIGILALVAIGLAFWGYKFIQGRNLFSSDQTFYVNYVDAGGITVGTPVTISGVSVGTVSGIKLNQQDRLVQATLSLRKDISVPRDARAMISTISLLGEKAIDLQYKTPCFGDGDCAQNESTLEGGVKGPLAAFLGDNGEEDMMNSLKTGISGAIDTLNQTLFGEASSHPIARSSRDLSTTMENMKGASEQLEGILVNNRREIDQTMNNLRTLSSSLARKSGSIERIVNNADSLSQSLADADLGRTIDEATESLRRLRGTLDEADKALGGVSEMVSTIKNGDGTLGKLIYDEEIYRRLNSASQSIDTLATDLQERPYRYVPFKSRKRVLKFDRKDAKLDEEDN